MWVQILKEGTRWTSADLVPNSEIATLSTEWRRKIKGKGLTIASDFIQILTSCYLPYCRLYYNCPFMQLMRFSRQVYWGGLPVFPPGDHVFSELSTWPVRLGWPSTTWLMASLIYTSPFTTTSQWSVKGMNWGKLWEVVRDREAWRATVHGVAKSWTRLSKWTGTLLEL